ncbi:hypothetical protein HK104_003588 [Borealophlyctis nickersoniae]|nr:hypothetical protein HK104_003588 [Borealophlyctis nickersoniae]
MSSGSCSFSASDPSNPSTFHIPQTHATLGGLASHRLAEELSDMEVSQKQPAAKYIWPGPEAAMFSEQTLQSLGETVGPTPKRKERDGFSDVEEEIPRAKVQKSDGLSDQDDSASDASGDVSLGSPPEEVAWGDSSSMDVNISSSYPAASAARTVRSSAANSKSVPASHFMLAMSPDVSRTPSPTSDHSQLPNLALPNGLAKASIDIGRSGAGYISDGSSSPLSSVSSVASSIRDSASPERPRPRHIGPQEQYLKPESARQRRGDQESEGLRSTIGSPSTASNPSVSGSVTRSRNASANTSPLTVSPKRIVEDTGRQPLKPSKSSNRLAASGGFAESQDASGGLESLGEDGSVTNGISKHAKKSKQPPSVKRPKASKLKIDATAPTKLLGVYVPAGLTNPFAPAARSHIVEDPELLVDLDLIRIGTEETCTNPSERSNGGYEPRVAGRRGSGASASSSHRSAQNGKMPLVKHSGAPMATTRHSARLGSPSKMHGIDKEMEDQKTAANDDHCSACLGRGTLLCCDSCPRAFHFQCVEEGFSAEDVPDGLWECRTCRAKGSTATRGSSRKGARGSPKTKNPPGLFDQLLLNLEAANPRVFELPRDIRECYEGVFTHPVTGAYVDTNTTEITPLARTSKSSKSGKKGAASAAPASEVSADVCFKCGGSGLKLPQSTFLHSHSVSQPRSIVPGQLSWQAQRSPIIKCDYCPLYWHLDCLDPPLTSVPVELDESQKETVDVAYIKHLRAKTWGRTNGWDTDANIGLGRVARPRTSDGASPVFDGDADSGVIQIRRKWMCPCHSHWAMPKQRRAKVIDSKIVDITEEGTGLKEEGELRGLHGKKRRGAQDTTQSTKRQRRESGPEASALRPPASPSCSPTRNNSLASTPLNSNGRSWVPAKRRSATVSKSSKNDGYIDIINEPGTDDMFARRQASPTRRGKPRSSLSPTRQAGYQVSAPAGESSLSIFEIDGVRYRLPERRIKLDFIDRVRDLGRLRANFRSDNANRPVIEKLPDGQVVVDEKAARARFPGLDEQWDCKVRELYPMKWNTNEVGAAGRGLTPLACAATMASLGGVEKLAGPLRADDAEAEEWLQSIALFQAELATRYAMRRAANAYLSTQMAATNVDGEGERPLREQQKEPHKTDCPIPSLMVRDNAATNSGVSVLNKEPVPQPATEQNAASIVTLRADDPEWLAFQAWRKEQAGIGGLGWEGIGEETVGGKQRIPGESRGGVAHSEV